MQDWRPRGLALPSVRRMVAALALGNVAMFGLALSAGAADGGHDSGSSFSVANAWSPPSGSADPHLACGDVVVIAHDGGAASGSFAVVAIAPSGAGQVYPASGTAPWQTTADGGANQIAATIPLADLRQGLAADGATAHEAGYHLAVEVGGNAVNFWLGCSDGGPSPSPSPLPSATPEPTSTPAPTATPEPTFTPAPTATPEPTSTPAPTATPEPTSTPSGTPGPTSRPEPSDTPRPTPTPEPTHTPKPTPAATPQPTSTPRPTATASPAPASTPRPTGAPATPGTAPASPPPGGPTPPRPGSTPQHSPAASPSAASTPVAPPPGAPPPPSHPGGRVVNLPAFTAPQPEVATGGVFSMAPGNPLRFWPALLLIDVLALGGIAATQGTGGLAWLGKVL